MLPPQSLILIVWTFCFLFPFVVSFNPFFWVFIFKSFVPRPVLDSTGVSFDPGQDVIFHILSHSYLIVSSSPSCMSTRAIRFHIVYRHVSSTYRSLTLWQFGWSLWFRKPPRGVQIFCVPSFRWLMPRFAPFSMLSLAKSPTPSMTLGPISTVSGKRLYIKNLHPSVDW